MPMLTDELQAFSSSDALPVLETEVGSGLDFIPIIEMTVRSPSERESGLILASQQHKQLASNALALESMAPPKALPPLSTTQVSTPLTSSKRKSSSILTEEQPISTDATKKPRRALKSRQAKRSKI